MTDYTLRKKDFLDPSMIKSPMYFVDACHGVKIMSPLI